MSDATEAAERWRARYFEVRAGRGSPDAFRAEIAGFDPPATTRLRGLPVSCCPSARFVQLRFVAASEIDETLRGRFARPCQPGQPDQPDLLALFVDPADLSYHCFESIVGLDAYFEGLDDAALQLDAQPAPAAGIARWHATMSEDLARALAGLDALDLWLEPRGPTRGGRRFVFHAAALAAALTTALRRSLGDTLPGFVHVNPVFRCNRFEPDDAPFEAHVDAPFSWSARKLVSTKTLLLYLSSGSGPGLLRFGEGATSATIDELRAGDLIVFDQALVHAGRPYAEGPKLFVRSELIVHDPTLTDSPELAALFAKACWLDSQVEGDDPFALELARFANAQYDRVSLARTRGRLASPTTSVPEPFVHHVFAGVHFVTNGYDGYFRKADVDPIEAATLMLLELLNPLVGELPYREIAEREVLVRSGTAWIAAFLAGFPPPAEPPFSSLDADTLFPPPETPGEYLSLPQSLDFAPLPAGWDSCRQHQVIDIYAKAQRWAAARISTAPITLLGHEVFVARERFVVRRHHIHLLGDAALGPLHFAGAIMLEPNDFLDADLRIGTLTPIVPPLEFHERGELLHLTCDLFRNSWMVGAASDAIPIPIIRPGDEVHGDWPRWHLAAAQGSRTREQLERELDGETP